jgi:hypothetical protein
MRRFRRRRRLRKIVVHNRLNFAEALDWLAWAKEVTPLWPGHHEEPHEIDWRQM